MLIKALSQRIVAHCDVVVSVIKKCALTKEWKKKFHQKGRNTWHFSIAWLR